MSRLLFAAARGARIQRRHFKDAWNYWESTRVMLLTNLDKTDSDYDYRIHPDDEHLQYGPVSTALRERADCDLVVKSNWVDPLLLQVSVATNYADQWGRTWREQTVFERSLALLIQAEELADEGM